MHLLCRVRRRIINDSLFPAVKFPCRRPQFGLALIFCKPPPEKFLGQLKVDKTGAGNRRFNERLVEIRRFFYFREELFSVQQDRGRLDADIEERNKELERLKSDMEEQKALRINEEAALVRLKLQISNLKKETKSPEKKEETKKKPEDMIDEFPDDIFTGSVEEVDLSDDEE